MENKNKPLKEEIKKNEEEFERNKKYFEGLRKETTKMKEEKLRKQKEEEEKLKQKYNLNKEEIEQIEKWTNKKCGEVIYDSNNQNWDTNTVFYDKIWNKKNFVIITEDTDNNKFGGYLTTQVTKSESWHNDSNSFIFSLQSNGRINGMKQFKIKNSDNAFWLCNRGHWAHFAFGNGCDYCVHGGNDKSSSYCKQCDYNYEGETHSLSANGGT